MTEISSKFELAQPTTGTVVPNGKNVKLSIFADGLHKVQVKDNSGAESE
jgi:hypothetical protein